MSTFSRSHCLLLFFLMPVLAFGQGEKKGPANYVVFGLGTPGYDNDASRYAYMFKHHFGIDGKMDLDFDWADVALKITEGYHLNKYLALEGGLFFLDKSTIVANVATTEGETITTSQEKFELKHWGYDLYALGKYPIRRWLTITAKLGGAHWWADTQRLSTGDKRNKKSARGLLGLGLHSAITERLLLKLDWTKSDIDNVDFSMVSLSLGVTY